MSIPIAFPGALALAAALAAGPGPADAEPWHYVIGEARGEQQGNFCETEADVAEVARVFERYGPRPGYSALSYVETCVIAVDTFIPREVVRRVVISKGEPDEYTVYFVRVETGDGATRYLVTTRHVREPAQ